MSTQNNILNTYNNIQEGLFFGLKDILSPLINTIQKYDSLKSKLEKEGNIKLIEDITNLLKKELVIKHHNKQFKLSLKYPGSVYECLGKIYNGNISIDIRKTQNGMPKYYLCRFLNDRWSRYKLIIEDLYRSPDYNIVDERFARLMYCGHEIYFLRVSHLYVNIVKMFKRNKLSHYHSADDYISDLGRYILKAAWHESQIAGILIAEHFGLANFRQATELLYLCLNSDLCALRGKLNESLLTFFKELYIQPSICSFLKQLPLVNGHDLKNLHDMALSLFSEMSMAFGDFLETQVYWSMEDSKTSLFKLIFGNYSRLDLIDGELKRDNAIISATEELESVARKVICNMNNI